MSADEYDDPEYTDDEKAIASDEALAALEEIRTDFEACFTSPRGERVLHELYRYCRQMSSTFVEPTADVNGRYQAYLEGRRSVILKIMEYLTLDDLTIINRARDLAQKRTI